ncbi:hypothetical protein HK099_000335, partial [Clydaea vesicula]
MLRITKLFKLRQVKCCQPLQFRCLSNTKTSFNFSKPPSNNNSNFNRSNADTFGNEAKNSAGTQGNSKQPFSDAARFRNYISEGVYEAILYFIKYDQDGGAFSAILPPHSPLRALTMEDWTKLLVIIKYNQFRKSEVGTKPKVERLCERILERVRQCGFRPLAPFYTALANIYTNNGNAEKVQHCINTSPNVMFFGKHLLAQAYAINNDYERCFLIVDEIAQIKSSSTGNQLAPTLNRILSSIEVNNPNGPEFIQKILSYYDDLSITRESSLYDTLIQYYSNSDNYDKIISLMQEKKELGLNATTKSYNALLLYHSRHDPTQVLTLFEEMYVKDIPATTSTFNVVMEAAAKLKNLPLVFKIYFGMMGSHLSPNHNSWAIMAQAIVDNPESSLKLEELVKEAGGKLSTNLIKTIYNGLFKLLERGETHNKAIATRIKEYNEKNKYALTKKLLQPPPIGKMPDPNIYTVAKNIRNSYENYLNNNQLQALNHIDLLYLKIIIRFDMEEATKFLGTLNRESKFYKNPRVLFETGPLVVHNEIYAYNDYIKALCYNGMYETIYPTYQLLKSRQVRFTYYTYDKLLLGLILKYNDTLKPGDPIPTPIYDVLWDYVKDSDYLGFPIKKRYQCLFHLLDHFVGTGTGELEEPFKDGELQNWIRKFERRDGNFVWPVIKEGKDSPYEEIK